MQSTENITVLHPMNSLLFINLNPSNEDDYWKLERWFNDQIEKCHRPIWSNQKLRFRTPNDIHKFP